MPPEEVTEEIAEDIADDKPSAEDAGATEEAVETDIEGEVILDGISFDPPKKAAEKQPAAKPEEKAEEKPAPTELETRMADLEKNYNSASAHIKDLQRALHETRQENKQLKDAKGAAKGEEDFLSDEQVMAIIQEHRDDPQTMLRVINHQAAKAAAKAGSKVKDDVETKQIQQRLNGFLEQEWPEVVQEGSEIRPHVDKTKAELGIEGHPYADFLAAGAHFMTNWRRMAENLVKQTEERVKKEALGDKTEASRKKVVSNTALAGKSAAEKSKAAPAVSANFDAIAKQMNMTPNQRKIYQRLVGKGGGMSSQAGA